MDLTVHCLLYGNEVGLHRRLLDSLLLEVKSVRVKLWCNEVGEESRKLVTGSGRECQHLHGNEPKYHVVTAALAETSTEWVCWMDDDTHLVSRMDDGKPLPIDWLGGLDKFLAQSPKAVYVGGHGQRAPSHKFWVWCRTQPWWTNRQPATVADGRPTVDFAPGSYWLMKMDVVRRLGWPGPDFDWRGGDVALGEAVWQNGNKLSVFHDNVRYGDAPTRDLTIPGLGSFPWER